MFQIFKSVPIRTEHFWFKQIIDWFQVFFFIDLSYLFNLSGPHPKCIAFIITWKIYYRCAVIHCTDQGCCCDLRWAKCKELRVTKHFPANILGIRREPSSLLWIVFQVYIKEALEALKKGQRRNVLEFKVQLNKQIFFQHEKIFFLDIDVVVWFQKNPHELEFRS